MRIILILLIISISGCSSPYRDDYAKHINLLKDQYIPKNDFTFHFNGQNNVDLRGVYSQENNTTSSGIAYHGGAGLAGMLVQIGTHAAIVNSQRNGKLSKEQEHANKSISILRDLAEDMQLVKLLDESDYENYSFENRNSDSLNITPIFFSNNDMTELSLKSIIWMTSDGSNKVKYKNIIQVYNRKLSEVEHEKLMNGNQEVLSQILSSLLKTTLYIAKNELSGEYTNKESVIQTILIKQNKKQKVIRGTVIAEKCGYQVIKNLHSWFIVYSKDQDNNSINECFIYS